ncbi:Family 3 adenylate cyclase [Bosea sp. LC85]|uniref:adenylate/guanylate cyclase domain-containing protein n=1 Tax=Bosea sp. LC85 TaxID=1502851 RepID=UPI0004E36729|nr:adenylate/guanylate cyclase domain-containing protein [Bosea sp. LC85]KFC75864.1 Family 3 adenylate cyclase [Bosea sp. LC85]
MALFYPNNLYVAGLIMAAAAIGIAPLGLRDSRYERTGRYALFAFDAVAIGAMLVLAPLSSGIDVPQNLVFLSSRPQYYYVIVAVSVLTLSPRLVIWTGMWATISLFGATIWIISGMDYFITFGDLPSNASRNDYLSNLLNPNFFSTGLRVNQAVLIAVVTGIAALAVHRARGMVRAHAAAEAERFRIERIFGRYVPAQVAQQLLQAGQLVPQQRNASIIFADVEGFTRLSETLAPAEVIGLLNAFFSAATAVVEAHGGVVVNHVGDALIAAFNAPLPVEGYPARAVNAARALLSLVSERDFHGHQLRLRVGVATGPVAAGTVGAAERQTYTLYGDTVNLAQRLEQLNKELKTDGLICGTTFEACRGTAEPSVAMGSVHVRGRAAAIDVFALKG